MGLQVQGTLKIVLEVVDANVSQASAKAAGDVTRLEGAVKKSGETAQRAGVGFKDLAGAFTTLSIARTIAGGLLAMVKPAIDLEEGMTRLRAETGGTAAELEHMQAAALSAAAQTAFSPTEAIEGMIALRKSSLDAASAAAAIGPAMQLAQVGAAQGLTVAESARTAGLLFKQFGHEGQQLVLDMDQLAAASQIFGFRLKDTENIVGRIGEAATRSGGSFRDLLITFGLASRQIPSNTRLAGELTRTLENLSDSKKRHKLAEAFGIDAMDQATGRVKNLNRLLVELASGRDITTLDFQTRLKDVGFTAAGLRPILAGIQQLSAGMRDANGQILQGDALINALEQQLDGAGGRLASLSEIMLGAFGPALEAAGEELQGFMAELGMPTVKVFSRVLREAVSVFKGFVAVMKLPILKEFSQLLFGVAIVGGFLATGFAIAMAASRLLAAAVAFTAQTLALYTGHAATATVATNTLAGASMRATVNLRAQAVAAQSAGTGAGRAGAFLGKLAIAAAVGIAAFSIFSRFIKFAARALGLDLVSADIAAIEQQGILNTLFLNTVDLLTQLGFITDAHAKQLRNNVRPAIDTSQQEQDRYNTALERYIELTSKAAKVEYPPRVNIRHLHEAADALERMTRSQDAATRSTAASGFAASQEADRLFAVGRQRQLTVEEFALLKQKVLEAETALGNLGPEFDRERDRLHEIQEALQATGSEGNLQRTAIALAQGTFGPTSREAGEAEGLKLPMRPGAPPVAPAPTVAAAQDPRARARGEVFAAQLEVNRLRTAMQASSVAGLASPVGAIAAMGSGAALIEAMGRLDRAVQRFERASANMRVSLDVNETNAQLGEARSSEENRGFGPAGGATGRNF